MTWDIVDDDDRLQSLDNYLEKKQESMEERVVRAILKHYDKLNELSSIKGANKDLSDKYGVTLHAFREVFPSFPVYIAAKDVYKAREVELATLSKKFISTPIFKAYEDALDTAAELDFSATGLVFDWKLPGLNILHNLQGSSSCLPGFRIECVITSGENQIVYTIETFAQFLQNLEWMP